MFIFCEQWLEILKIPLYVHMNNLSFGVHMYRVHVYVYVCTYILHSCISTDVHAYVGTIIS